MPYTTFSMNSEFEKLRLLYGNHTRAAEALGVTPRHYRRIRRYETGLSLSLRKLIGILISQGGGQNVLDR